MRLSWYIYVPIMITAVGLTWFVRTKDMDFMPDTTVDAVEEEVVEEPFVLVGPPAPAKVDEEAFDAGFTLLGLDHFSNYLDNPQELLRTFKILKSKDNTELTYLAGERIMEHASISKEEKREQVPAMVEYSIRATCPNYCRITGAYLHE